MEHDNTGNTSDTSRSVHLSASAGSGKTRALKDRYIALLHELDRRGLSLDQAVAITFTEKAAAEIRERVIRDLPEEMLKKIIRGRQDLRISTIHSFCMNLLKRYPLEAGLPPDFGVLDDRDKAALVRMAALEALEAAEETVPEALIPFRGRSGDSLVGAVEHLFDIRGRVSRMEIDAGGPDSLLRTVREGTGMDRAGEELRALVSGAEWKRRFEELERILRQEPRHYATSRGAEHLLLAGGKDEPSDELLSLYFTQKDAPRKKAAIAKKDLTGDRQAYEDAYFAVQELLGRRQDLAARVRAGSETVGLLALFLLAEDRYEQAKLREGLLDFDDLEIRAYRLLRGLSSPDILYWLDRKVLHFLVDEFQDTSDLQWSVLSRLTEEIFAGQGAVKPMQPTLFVVGDAKQSIYRFREANYRLIETVRERMETNLPGASRVIGTLDRNYRSTPEVVGAVNQVFGSLWGAGYVPSEARRADHRGSVRLIEAPSPGALPPSAGDDEFPTRAAPDEAAVLASEVRSFVAAGTPVHVRDGDGWTERPAGYDDCAVLIPSRTRLKEYEAALRKEGVPFRVVGGIGFYEEDEVQAVLAVLFYLRNSDDRLALAAALRSPLFGLAEQDLYAVLRGGGAESLRRVHPGAADLLSEWKRYANTELLGGLVHRIIRDSGAYLRFGRRNAQAVFNLDKLLDTAREFDRRGHTTLEDFVEWVRNIRDLEQREATADMNLPGTRGAVSVMTVHKAKGLEFAAVFLPGMNRQSRSLTSSPEALIEGDGGLRMAARSDGSPFYAELWEREQAELLREHQRLLYVAMTRARDHLVMIGELGAGRSPVRERTWLSFLRSALPLRTPGETAALPVVYAYPAWQAEEHAPTPAASPKEAKEAGTAVDPAALLTALSPVAGPKAPAWKRATDLLDQDREWTADQGAPGPGGPPVSPLTRGSILHRCLEVHSLEGSFDAGAVIAEFPEATALSEEARARLLADVNAVLGRITGTEELAWIFHRGPASYSELPFLLRRGSDIVSGIMDRVVVRDDGRGYVVDYKAIAVENEDALQSWLDHYRPQLKVYCEAVREMFRLEHVEGYLLFLDSARLALAVKA